MSSDLDFTKVEDARRLIEKGNEEVKVNCSSCQGHSWPGRKAGEPGYCSSCDGEAYVRIPLWERWGWEAKIDYWQARALVAEMELKTLREG